MPYTAVSLFQEAAWEKSFASEPNGGSCVEVNLGREGMIGVRDTKLATSPLSIQSRLVPTITGHETAWPCTSPRSIARLIALIPG